MSSRGYDCTSVCAAKKKKKPFLFAIQPLNGGTSNDIYWTEQLVHALLLIHTFKSLCWPDPNAICTSV